LKRISRAIAGAAFAGTALTVIASSVNAQPGSQWSAIAFSGASTTSLVEPVQYRGRAYVAQRRGRSYGSYRNYGYGRSFGRNTAIGVGSLIIGGIILSEVARSEHRREHASDWSRCAQTYRSFEADTGMYTGYDGIRRPCPYLN